MSVFRKILSSSKNKVKITTNDKTNQHINEKDLEDKRVKWQKELEGMSEFLVMKQSKEDDIVDTAYIDDDNGLPVFKAIFDVSGFKRDEIQLKIEGDKLYLEAKNRTEKEDRAFVKTIKRSIDLPSHVDEKLMRTNLNEKGYLVIDMPFHLPPRNVNPTAPGTYPITTDLDGSRKLRLSTDIGQEFTIDDINVYVDDKDSRTVRIRASYQEGAGQYEELSNIKRDIQRDLRLPPFLKAKEVKASLSPNGTLFIEITLEEPEKNYRCSVTCQDVSEHLTNGVKNSNKTTEVNGHES